MSNLTALNSFFGTMEPGYRSLYSITRSLCGSSALLLYLGLVEDGSEAPGMFCGIFNLLAAIFLVYVGRKLYHVIFSPLDLYKDLGSVGYVHHEPLVPKRDYVQSTQRRKKIGDTPPVFPNGWFRALDSKSLKKRQVKSIYLFGEQLALFRNERGRVRAMDAYCPHLGANMAAGGKVVGADCLECPFHGWKFSGETGQLVDIPYSQKVPNFVSVRTWHCCEVNGIIFVWYHCDNEPPAWQIPPARTLSELKYVGCTEHIINAHIQDVPENAADIAHLDHLHKPVIGNDVEKTNDSIINNVVRHGIKAQWQPSTNPREGHCSTMSIVDSLHLVLFGMRIDVVEVQFDITQIGAGVVLIEFQAPFVKGLILQNITPIEPLRQKLSHSFYFSPSIPVCLAKLLCLGETTQIERDILIWNNKTYLRKPILVKEESTLAQHRRWYQQFYSANSPRLNAEGKLVYPAKCDVTDW